MFSRSSALVQVSPRFLSVDSPREISLLIAKVAFLAGSSYAFTGTFTARPSGVSPSVGGRQFLRSEGFCMSTACIGFGGFCDYDLSSAP